jgi:hypothetical protein
MSYLTSSPANTGKSSMIENMIACIYDRALTIDTFRSTRGAAARELVVAG